MWNDLIEPLQEAADLGTNRLSHTPLCHKLNILTLKNHNNNYYGIINILQLECKHDNN